MQRVAGMILVLLVCTATLALADRVDREVQRLQPRKSYKARLSAVLYLSKSDDPRAIRALIRAVKKDTGRTIRRIAATALGKAAGGDATDEVLRSNAVRTLRQVRRSDRDRKVRRSASRALKRLRSIAKRPAASSRRSARLPTATASLASVPMATRGLFVVHVQSPRDSTGSAPRGALNGMRQVVKDSLSDHAQVSIGKLPQRRPDTHGVFVGLSVDSLRIKSHADYNEVHCAVSIQVNPWEGGGRTERWQMDQAAQASGKGRAVAAPGRVGIGTAKLNCLVTVTRSVASRRLAPFIRRVSTDRTFAQRRPL